MYSIYEYKNMYETYLDNKINNEQNIALAINSLLPVNEAYNNIRAINEGKISDRIKNLWNRFIKFIKSVADKFIETMNNLFDSNKKYLEKYKDIILKKKGKENLKITFSGDYVEGINRIRNYQAKLFNIAMYEPIKIDVNKDEDDNSENNYENTLKQIMPSATSLAYDESDNLSDILKDFFIAKDRGDQERTFDQLNFTDMYNFCYNFEKIKGICDKDLNILNQNTTAIERAVNSLEAKTESAILEADENNTNTDNNNTNNNNGGEEKEKSGDTELKITNSDFTKGSESYSKDDKEKAGNEDDAKAIANATDAKDKDITIKVITKFKTATSTMITAKYTACQHIAEDYMKIIRAHVRSYGGESKLTEDDRKNPQKATNYNNK